MYRILTFGGPGLRNNVLMRYELVTAPLRVPFPRRTFLSGLKSKIKDIVGIQKTKEEKQRDQIDSTLNELTRGAPAPIKALAWMAKPLISKVMSSAASAMEEIRDVKSTALSLIQRNNTLSSLLGSPMEMLPPMFTASNSMNGDSMMELHCIVVGGKGQGMAKIKTRQGEIVEVS